MDVNKIILCLMIYMLFSEGLSILNDYYQTDICEKECPYEGHTHEEIKCNIYNLYDQNIVLSDSVINLINFENIK